MTLTVAGVAVFRPVQDVTLCFLPIPADTSLNIIDCNDNTSDTCVYGCDSLSRSYNNVKDGDFDAYILNFDS